MTFGGTLHLMLEGIGYSLVTEFLTADGRMAVRLRDLRSSTVVAMYHTDAIQLANGEATLEAIVHRNRSVFGPLAEPDGSGESHRR